MSYGLFIRWDNIVAVRLLSRNGIFLFIILFSVVNLLIFNLSGGNRKIRIARRRVVVGK